MEMSIYERESFLLSISNLAVLKLFYDAGVDVKKILIDTYMVDVEFDMNVSFQIIYECLESLFDLVEVVGHYDDLDHVDEEYLEILEHSLGGDEIIFIRDALFDYIFSSKYAEEFVSYVKQASRETYYSEYIEFNVALPQNIFYIELSSVGFYHDIAEMIIDIRNKAIELKKKLESE